MSRFLYELAGNPVGPAPVAVAAETPLRYTTTLKELSTVMAVWTHTFAVKYVFVKDVCVHWPGMAIAGRRMLKGLKPTPTSKLMAILLPDVAPDAVFSSENRLP